MSTNLIRKYRRRILEALFFLAVMGLTFYTIFSGQNMVQIWTSMKSLSVPYLFLAIFSSLFFVCAEGLMIFYLLKSLDGKSSVGKCIVYSFVGFFYSGITPSATGGQPVQLYYMKKDGNRLSDSSVVLMTVALMYKLVLVLIGAAVLIFWHEPLRIYLREYFYLYLIGLFLNVILVVILLAVMLAPKWMNKLICGIERLAVRIKILKPSAEREDKIKGFIDGYQDAVQFLLRNKIKVGVVLFGTFIQRSSLFILTWFIYRGFSLQGTDSATIVLLQAAVYIAVDMLPVPGAQGITELMYRSIFLNIFTENYLMPSLYVTRGVSFYFVLVVSLLIVLGRRFLPKAALRSEVC